MFFRKNLEDHDSTLFQTNGIILKNGKKFHNGISIWSTSLALQRLGKRFHRK